MDSDFYSQALKANEIYFYIYLERRGEINLGNEVG